MLLGELNQVQVSYAFVRKTSHQLPEDFAPTGTWFSTSGRVDVTPSLIVGERSLHLGTIYGMTSLIAGTSLLLGMFKIQGWELR